VGSLGHKQGDASEPLGVLDHLGIVVVAVLGAAFTLLVGAIGRRLSPWYADRE